MIQKTKISLQPVPVLPFFIIDAADSTTAAPASRLAEYMQWYA
jgi:hypothetical protein